MDYFIHTADGLYPKNTRPITKHHYVKYIVAMKLFLLLLALSFHLSAKVYSQQINLNAKEESLKNVLRSIKKQTGYGFLLVSSSMKDAMPVTVTLHLSSVEDALKKIFETQNLTYTIENKFITIRPKADKKKDQSPATLAYPETAPIIIKGRVTDRNNIPLAGVNVRVKGKSIGTITDGNGHYSLSIEASDILIFSYIGFLTSEIPAKGRGEINAQLKELQSQLEETVVKGYYNTTQALNTGSVTTIKAEVLGRQPVSDPIMALEGRVPGLYIQQQSGIPGAGMDIKLRGQNSIANGNNPLYIVDGVPFTSNSLSSPYLTGAAGGISPFSAIPMSDIERIEVLKDADATAIYGSRGANGVILITTKKGKQGKTRLSVNVYNGVGKATRFLSLMNSDQYLQMRNKAFANDGASVGTTDYDLNGKWGDIHKNTDWQKVLIGGTSRITNGQATISGGNAQTQFLFGGSYRKETTVFPGNYNDRKASANINVNHESENKRFKATISASYLNNNSKLPVTDFTQNILQAPNSPELYNSDGSFNWQNSTWQNPLWPTINNSVSVSDNLNSSMNLSYMVLKNLKVNVRAGYNDIKMETSNITTFEGYNPAVIIDPQLRTNRFGTNRLKSWIAEPSINYDFELGKGKMESLVGATFQQNDQHGIIQTASGFNSVATVDNISAAATVRVDNFVETRYRYSAVYARLGYNYDDQYLINLTGRRDASSRFGPGKQFANFGAIGAAWIFSKQSWMEEQVPLLSFGKIRASFGLTGNDQLSDYSFLSTYSSNGTSYQGVPSLNPTQLTNPKYGWETVKKFEAAIDLGFLHDRILFNFNWYRNRTGNQLVGYSLPDITGFPTVQANLPAVIQNTGIEMEFTSKNIVKGDFTWTTSANLSIPKNKLISYPNLASSSYANQYVIGKPLFISFMYHYTGLDKSKGIYTFQDQNGDGQITYSEDRIPVFVGQQFFGGINNSFTYKGLQLDVFLQFVKQNGYQSTNSFPPGIFSSSGTNQLSSILNNPNVQPFTQNWGSDAANAFSTFSQSDGIVGDASFIRLKNVSLSWNLPKPWLTKAKISNARIYMEGQNLATFTSFQGLDPEIQSFSGGGALRLPPLRMFILGIQLDL